ncbi:heterokaryon incompatibility protein-domain-containing protein, partial [Lasiosphaeris hirsuta]
IGRSASVPVSLDLQHCLSVVRPLLEECVRSHQLSCRQESLTELPARLLDLGTIAHPHVKLVLTQDIIHKNNLSYAALSHCWGSNGNLVRTTTQNIGQHGKTIGWDEFSKTFQDTILVTRGLGLRYLWIDSVCIIQDSVSDWASESKRMGTIYSNAHLTLSATGSADGSGGCLFPRWVKGPGVAQRVRETVTIHSGTHNGHSFKVNARLTFEAAHQQFGTNGENLARLMAPLMSRAWCFQERIMSTRVLHFHSEEIVWECATSTACECGFLKGPAGLDRGRFEEKPYRLQASQVFQGARAKEEAFNTWRGLASQYSGLLLTRETDRLPALAGLAQRFQDIVECQYLAGLWADDLLRGLLWRRPMVGHSRRKVEGTGSTLPTWSWAS